MTQSTPGSIDLTHFDTAKHAEAALELLRTGLADGIANVTAIQRIDHGFIAINPIRTSTLDGGNVQPVIAGAAKGAIVVIIFTSVDSPEWVWEILTKQPRAEYGRPRRDTAVRHVRAFDRPVSTDAGHRYPNE